MSDQVSVKEWTLVPALITLAVTLLRLTGELMNWDSLLFSRAGGGGGSLIGISWLIPMFGFYFGWALAKRGHFPASMSAAWIACVMGLFLTVVMFVASVMLSSPALAYLVALACVIAIAVLALRAWGPLGKVLLVYALAARIPVAAVTLFAVAGSWGTHYEKGPPGYANSESVLVDWLYVGLLPQLTGWVAVTLVFGGLWALVGTHVGKRGQKAG